jgi:hypothetical protein
LQRQASAPAYAASPSSTSASRCSPPRLCEASPSVTGGRYNCTAIQERTAVDSQCGHRRRRQQLRRARSCRHQRRQTTPTMTAMRTPTPFCTRCALAPLCFQSPSRTRPSFSPLGALCDAACADVCATATVAANRRVGDADGRQGEQAHRGYGVRLLGVYGLATADGDSRSGSFEDDCLGGGFPRTSMLCRLGRAGCARALGCGGAQRRSGTECAMGTRLCVWWAPVDESYSKCSEYCTAGPCSRLEAPNDAQCGFTLGHWTSGRAACNLQCCNGTAACSTA